MYAEGVETRSRKNKLLIKIVSSIPVMLCHDLSNNITF